jgi:phosphate transport system substrate-binding protein
MQLKSRVLPAILVGLVFSLGAPPLVMSGENIRYEGSPAIGKFLEIASQVYPNSAFMMNVKTKSRGGEECIFKGTCDIGGVANQLKPEMSVKGVKATLIGKDAVAIIVNAANPLTSLSLPQLRDIFSGKVRNLRGSTRNDGNSLEYVQGR